MTVRAADLPVGTQIAYEGAVYHALRGGENSKWWRCHATKGPSTDRTRYTDEQIQELLNHGATIARVGLS